MALLTVNPDIIIATELLKTDSIDLFGIRGVVALHAGLTWLGQNKVSKACDRQGFCIAGL